MVLKFDKNAQAKSANSQMLELKNYKEKNGFNGMFIVDSGKCQIINKVGNLKEEFTTIHRGAFFGESIVLKVSVRLSTIDYLGFGVFRWCYSHRQWLRYWRGQRQSEHVMFVRLKWWLGEDTTVWPACDGADLRDPHGTVLLHGEQEVQER